MGSLTRSKSRSMRHLVWIPVILIAVVALAVAMPEARGQGHEGHDHGEEATQAQQTAQPAAVDSVRILEEAVAADSSYDNLYRLGIAYLDRDRASEAVRIFRRCTELKPKELKAWVNYGAAQDAIGHGGDARKAYREALGINADDEIALCRLAASLYAGAYRTEAMDTLRLTIREHPESYCAYFTLGVAFADAQMYEEAIRAWQKVVEFAPDTPEAQSARESISTLRQLLRTQ
jgi:tetratricopeptide (TPR) repeat protein